MENALKLSVKLKVKVKIGASWGELKDFDVWTYNWFRPPEREACAGTITWKNRDCPFTFFKKTETLKSWWTQDSDFIWEFQNVYESLFSVVQWLYSLSESTCEIAFYNWLWL